MSIVIYQASSHDDDRRYIYIYMREGSAKKNSYGKSRNGRTNINMEGQRSNDGDEGETSESFDVSDCSLRSGDLDTEKT